MSHVLPLSAITSGDEERSGKKAAVLGELRRSGFPVPDGFVVCTGTLADTMRTAGLAAETATSDQLANVHIPDDLRAEIRSAWTGLDADAVAVRSSGVAEDATDASFAGQYESVLDVRDLDAVVDAIRRCWASGFSERIAAYRAGGGAATSVAVLVQAMVPATAAGVAFTANPTTGNLHQTLISAVTGLGEELMGGSATGDEWVISDSDAELTSGAGDSIDADQAARIAELARAVAEHRGTPQDVEWAVESGRIALLQARPITALPGGGVEPIPIEHDIPPGFWVRDRNGDRPWVPMQRSVFLPVVDRVAGHLFRFTTGVVPTARCIGGWAYLNVPADTTFEAVAERTERIAAEITDGVPRCLLRRWHEGWKPDFAARIARLRETPVADLTDERFDGYFRELVALFGELHNAYFTLSGTNIHALAELGVCCAETMGWSAADTLRLIGGLTGDHMAAVVRLGELAAHAAESPPVRALLADRGERQPAKRLRAIDPDFAAAFEDYLDRYGHRLVEFDITGPSMAERPDTLLNLVHAQVQRPYDFDAEFRALERRRGAALAEARQAIADREESVRHRFEEAFAGTEATRGIRDEKVYYAVSLWALFRYATLELGRRLAAHDLVDIAEDAFYLEFEPGLAALRERTDQRAAVRTGRGQHTWALGHEPPPFYGEFPAPPPEEFPLSERAEHVRVVAGWAMSLGVDGGPARENGDGRLNGMAASAGSYTGPVRVIRDASDFGKLSPGDVLVCPETTAQWAVLFPNVGAVVTDRGSLLSHPAIIAREYGVPAVVATATATTTLRDDEVVTVDGGAGTVRTAPWYPVNTASDSA